MKECPKCKHVLDDSCDFCPYCGQSLVNVGNVEEKRSYQKIRLQRLLILEQY